MKEAVASPVTVEASSKGSTNVLIIVIRPSVVDCNDNEDT